MEQAASQDTFRQQIENALQEETRRHAVAELFGDADVLDTVQTAIQRTIARQLIAALGQPVLLRPEPPAPARECGPITFVIKRIDIPTSVQAAYNAIADPHERGPGDRGPLRGPRGLACHYPQLKAIESGQVTFWVLPDGANVVVPGPRDGPTTPTTPSSESAGRRPRRPRPEVGSPSCTDVARRCSP